MLNKDTCLVNLVSVTPIMFKLETQKTLKMIKTFIKRIYIFWYRDRYLFVCNIMHLSIIFGGRMIRLIILFWGCIAKFGVGFNNNEWFGVRFSSLNRIILSVLVQEARKFLSYFREFKRNILLQHSMYYQNSLQFWSCL